MRHTHGGYDIVLTVKCRGNMRSQKEPVNATDLYHAHFVTHNILHD